MKNRKKIWLMAVATTMLVGCYDYDESGSIAEPVSVELAYSLSSYGSGKVTRQAANVITSDETSPRLPHHFHVIPMINNAPRLAELNWETPIVKDNPNSRFYYSSYCRLNIGINGLLVYGSVDNLDAPMGTSPKMYNGSLIEDFPSVISTVDDIQEGISFSLESIHPNVNTIPVAAQTLADYMNVITQVDDWTESTDDFLKGLLIKFTNDGKSLPGSAASVKLWIEKFVESIQPSIDDANTSDDIKTILNHIKDEALTQVDNIGDINAFSYPRNYQLPDGAAVLRWADVEENNVIVKKFMPQTNATTLDNINSMARFAYPAPLYYYIASGIKASEEEIDFEDLYSQVTSNATKTAWEQVIENSKFNRTSVSSNTKAVVMTSPLQYAVAQVKVKIKANSGSLPDASSNSVAVGTTNFPLKGIIVCGQRPVDYKFEQREIEQGAVSDADVLFIYDNQVKADCYLTTQPSGTWAEGCNTLVLQSHQGEDVNIILEFENNSDQDFTCVDGVVYRGTRFYLIGKVEASLYTAPNPNVPSGNVFTKDYITTVNMTVSSLARAYNVPPNLLSNNLEIGVETTPQWEGATPSVIRLE